MRIGKALLATAFTVLPVVVEPWIVTGWRREALFVYVAAIFAGAYWTFSPDRRFAQVRNPTLNARFSEVFADTAGNLPADRRLPFRVHILRPRGLRWLPAKWTWVCERLVVAYAWGSKVTDQDFGKEWRDGAGLVSRVYQTGQYAWYHRDEHDLADFRMTDQDRALTEHVWAVFCLPIRRPADSDPDEPVNPRITAVLSIDAITKEAAEGLKEEFESFRDNRNRVWLDLAEWLGLYF